MVWQRPPIPGPRGRTGATGPSGGGGGGGTISTVSVTFPSDRWVRQTVVDAAATPSSKILVSVQTTPAFASDVEDEGWMYGAQVVSCATGSFDVVAYAVPVWGDDAADNPSGSVLLNYTVG